jgi:hypothetical protein
VVKHEEAVRQLYDRHVGHARCFITDLHDCAGGMGSPT